MGPATHLNPIIVAFPNTGSYNNVADFATSDLPVYAFVNISILMCQYLPHCQSSRRIRYLTSFRLFISISACPRRPVCLFRDQFAA